jgi:hypothetical protein
VQGVQHSPGVFGAVRIPPHPSGSRSDTAVGGRFGHSAPEASGQPSLGQWAEGNDAESFGSAQRNQLPLDLTYKQVVAGLERNEGIPAVLVGEAECLLQLVALDVTGPDVAHLADRTSISIVESVSSSGTFGSQ